MSPQDEREAIARIIHPSGWANPAETGLSYPAAERHLAMLRSQAFAKADAILALRQPRAEYRRAVEDAARAVEAGLQLGHEGYDLTGFIHSNGYLRAAASAIRLLPDTKGEGRD
jgi:hypothetical protein